MKLLILGLNYAPERIGVAVYTSGMAEALAAAGHEVRIIAGRPYYPGWAIMPGHDLFTYARSSENGVDVTRVPHYIPARPTGPRRLLHHASFALAASLPLLRQALSWRPDAVMAIAPALTAAPLARIAGGLCGARTWLHVQDFEAEAAIATGLLPSQGMVALLARTFEGAVLRGFDRVSAISPPMCRKLAEKGVDPARIRLFRNWADLDAVRPLAEPSSYRREWGIETPHVALYAGNIANKQGLDIVIEAARRLRHRTDLSIVICGEGPERARLQALAAGLPNVQFRDLQPRDRLGDLLGLASMHLLPQIAGAADLVLPSKLTNMLASGRPVVAGAEAGTGLAAEVEGCGILVPPGDAGALAAGMSRLCDEAELAIALGQAARRRAEQRWSAQAILGAFEAEITALCTRPARMAEAPS